MKRNNLSTKEAQKRIDAQSEAFKKESSDFIIENNSDLADLKTKVLNILSLMIPEYYLNSFGRYLMFGINDFAKQQLEINNTQRELNKNFINQIKRLTVLAEYQENEMQAMQERINKLEAKLENKKES